jgi:serine O-acetyltransferase
VVGIPGEVVRIDGERVDDLDQINIPDPVMAAIRLNQNKIEELESEIKKLEDSLK